MLSLKFLNTHSFTCTFSCSRQVLKVLEDVKSKLVVWKYQGAGVWAAQKGSPAAQGAGGVAVGEDVVVSAVWPDANDDLWLWRDG
jgi:hypothetical protein